MYWEVDRKDGKEGWQLGEGPRIQRPSLPACRPPLKKNGII